LNSATAAGRGKRLRTNVIIVGVEVIGLETVIQADEVAVEAIETGGAVIFAMSMGI